MDELRCIGSPKCPKHFQSDYYNCCGAVESDNYSSFQKQTSFIVEGDLCPINQIIENKKNELDKLLNLHKVIFASQIK